VLRVAPGPPTAGRGGTRPEGSAFHDGSARRRGVSRLGRRPVDRRNRRRPRNHRLFAARRRRFAHRGLQDGPGVCVGRRSTGGALSWTGGAVPPGGTGNVRGGRHRDVPRIPHTGGRRPRRLMALTTPAPVART